MLSYILRRLGSLIVTLWLTLSLTFFFIHFLPGNPIQGALNQSTISDAMLQNRIASLHLDQPLFTQYLLYFSDLLNFDLGLSWSGGMPVIAMIRSDLSHTISLAASAFLFALSGGLVLGILLYRKGRYATIIELLTSLSMSIPVMVSGTLLVFFFSIKLHLLPPSGQGGLSYLILPATSIAISMVGAIARWVESSLVNNQDSAFILLGEAKGLNRITIFFRYHARVSLLPLIDSSLLLFAFLLSGTFVTEILFARNGLGKLLVRAILEQDVPVIQAVVAVSALLFTAATLLADILHAVLDPRIRGSAQASYE